MKDRVSVEVGRIVQLSNQRGEPTARLIVADEIVKLRKSLDEAHRKYDAIYKQWQKDGMRAAVMVAFHKFACETVCHCQPFVDLAIPSAAVELTEQERP